MPAGFERSVRPGCTARPPVFGAGADCRAAGTRCCCPRWAWASGTATEGDCRGARGCTAERGRNESWFVCGVVNEEGKRASVPCRDKVLPGVTAYATSENTGLGLRAAMLLGGWNRCDGTRGGSRRRAVARLRLRPDRNWITPPKPLTFVGKEKSVETCVSNTSKVDYRILIRRIGNEKKRV